MKSIFSMIVALLLGTALLAQDVSIIPRPQQLEKRKGTFAINKNTPLIITDEGDRAAAEFFNLYIDQYFGFSLEIVNEANTPGIRLATRKFITAPSSDAYEFESGASGVRIEGDTYAGTFYGVQTLIQLLPSAKTAIRIPAVYVKDAPRFEYRGMHLDVARHFFSVDYIKQYIDYLALHKMNYFHWHLTDDQGWRIEIKKYPRLTQVGGYRNGTIIGRYPGKGNDSIRYGGFYTQEEVKEVVDYAAQRHITVVPEIEMPGHASAAIAAFPILSCFPNESTVPNPESVWAGSTEGKHVQQTFGVFDDVFCAGKETTFQFLQDVLDEVVELFPSKLIHIGGDECPKENWKRCEACQARMKENSLKDEHELQSYFVQRIEKYLNAKGREIIGWDEILEGGLAPNAAVMSWRGEEGGIAAAQQKHKVVMTPGGWLYFDYSQSLNEDSVVIGGYTPIEKTYSYEPIPSQLNEEEAKYIMGAQANLWTEYIKYPSKVEYHLLPRLAALSEVVWTKKELKDWDDFEKRLQEQFKRYQFWETSFSKAYFDLTTLVKPGKDGSVVWELSTKKKSPINYQIITESGDESKAPVKTYRDPLPVKGNTTMKAWVKDGNIILQKFNFSKTTGKTVTVKEPANSSYPGDGAFTLVNGVINEKGMGRSREFMGWSGKDCEAVIDFGKAEDISKVVVYSLLNAGSWIYPPKNVTVLYSNDGVNFTQPEQKFDNSAHGETRQLIVNLAAPIQARYIKVVAENLGLIPSGYPGAGHDAWLFIDEIQAF